MIVQRGSVSHDYKKISRMSHMIIKLAESNINLDYFSLTQYYYQQGV